MGASEVTKLVTNKTFEISLPSMNNTNVNYYIKNNDSSISTITL